MARVRSDLRALASGLGIAFALGAPPAGSYDARAEAPRALWEKRIVRIPARAPVFSGDTLWIVGTDRRLTAVDAQDGDRFWRRALPAPPVTAPVPCKEIVALAVDAGVPRLVALRRANGKTLWETTLPGATQALADGATGLLSLGTAGRLRCSSRADGALLWETDLGDAPAGFVRGDGDRRIYVLGRSDSLWCIEEEKGTTRWSVPTNGRFASAPALIGGRLVCAAYDGTIAIFSTEDGSAAGTSKGPAPVTRPPVPGDGRTFLIVGTGGELAAWSIEDTDPFWSLESKETNAAGAVRWKGVWIVPSLLGRVHAYSAEGSRRAADWSLTFRHPLRFPPAAAGNRIAFLDDEGHVTMCELGVLP